MVADIFGGSSVGTPEKSDGDSGRASGSEEHLEEGAEPPRLVEDRVRALRRRVDLEVLR